MQHFKKPLHKNEMYFVNSLGNNDPLIEISVSTLVKNLKTRENFSINVNGVNLSLKLRLDPSQRCGSVLLQFYLNYLSIDDKDVDDEDLTGKNFLIKGLFGYEYVHFRTESDFKGKHLRSFFKPGMAYSPTEIGYGAYKNITIIK